MPLRLHRHRLAEASDPNAFADLREVELLRQTLRRELRNHGGQRTLAREIGVHRETVRKFAEGQSTPSEPNLAEIREWAADRPEINVPMAVVALAVLVDDLSPPSRPGARTRIARLLLDLYSETGEGVPSWVKDELRGLGRAERRE
jgi:transcriptional regulator with XRE-family HTH domain